VRIASVARIHGPHDDGHFFMVTRYVGLFGWLRGRREFAVVRFVRDEAGWSHTYWSTSNDTTCAEVRDAVVRFERKERRENERARLRGDVHWQPVVERTPRMLQERAG
jgi:hypothetical protein